MSGCVGTRYLDEGESVLYRQRIKGNENVSAEKLDNVYRQESNSRLPLIPWAPYVWFYQQGLQRYDKQALEAERDSLQDYFDAQLAQLTPGSNKYKRLARKRRSKLNKLEKAINEGNLFMRWGEPLAVFDSTLADRTSNQMELYLFSKGYFDGRVTRKTKTRSQRTRVTYQVHEGRPYVVDSLVLVTRDTAIAQVMEAHDDETLLQRGDPYDADALEGERNRIDNLLKNNGYYSFSRQYVTFQVDTALLGERRVVVRTVIRTPPGQTAHKVYRVDSVIVTTDANQTGNITRQSRSYQGIQYQFYERQYSEKILNRRLFIRPDSLYSRENTLATQRQLANLDNFKFINIKYDTLGGHFIARVFTSPLPKRQISDEIGIIVSQGLPGPQLNVTFTNRNIFGGLENLQTSGRFGLEGVPSASNDSSSYQSIEAGGNMSLIFPQFLLPVSDAFKRKLGYVNPRTRAQVGYSYTDRPEYNRSNFNAGWTYTWETRRGTRYNYTLLDLSLINSTIKSESFQSFLDELASKGNPLRRTFLPSLVSGMNVNSTYNFLGTPSDDQSRAAYLRVLLDVGGTVWNLVDPSLVTERGLQYYQYFKVNTDWRHYRPLGKGSVLAYRVNLGVAGSYAEGRDNQILPFEKYFFAGGSNGIRAWSPRRLGPGSYRPVDDEGNLDYSFEQQGEILLEASVEWRRQIFGVIDGALFMDAGNVWMTREDPSRPGAQFQSDRFWKEIAIGSGAGLRIDFSFLILRLDMGVKLYDPAFAEGNRWFPDAYDYSQIFSFSRSNVSNLNLGIGYPF